MHLPGRRLVAQLSDPHIVEPGRLGPDGVDTAAGLAAAVTTLRTLDPAPELLLCTGDLVNDGRDAQYAHLRELLAPVPCPVRLLCGNHDDPDGLRRAFPDHLELGTDGPCDYVVDELDPLRIVALDTRVPGQPSGQLTGGQLRWLDDALTRDGDRPTIVALHHPPFPTGIGHMDAMGLDPGAADGLAAIVRRHPQVELVVSGHLHRSITRRFAGTVASTVPSTGQAIALDLAPGIVTGGWSEEPPAIALHLWRAGAGVVTHLRAIGPYGQHRFGPKAAETAH